MGRSSRLFEIIQLLRVARTAVPARVLAAALEVTVRTVYRDIVSLQAMRVPIEGEAGVGYVMRGGFDLPPLMFTPEEIEAIVVGLSLLGRTGDGGLQAAAASVTRKIATVLPAAGGQVLGGASLQVSRWHALPRSDLDLRAIRSAIRDEDVLRIVYRDGDLRRSERSICPIVLIYYVDSVVLVAWCRLRDDVRHFRTDRIERLATTGASFKGEGERLRAAWQARQAAGGASRAPAVGSPGGQPDGSDPETRGSA